MVSLKAAKCPSCGADIEVNPDLEKGICQFCGSTILIQDAIQKIRVEHTGTIKVEGIQGESELLDIVKNHIRFGETYKAYDVIEEILKINPYNLEALNLYLDLRQKDLKKYADMDSHSFMKSNMVTDEPTYYELFKKRLSNLAALDEEQKYGECIYGYRSIINAIERNFAHVKEIEKRKEEEEEARRKRELKKYDTVDKILKIAKFVVLPIAALILAFITENEEDEPFYFILIAAGVYYLIALGIFVFVQKKIFCRY